MAPKRLGTYEVVEQIGRGGMGVVYAARHVKTGERVAIKVLAAELTSERGFLERFLREVKVLRQLDHPNIVRFIEAGQEGQYHFYVMEYIDGHSLAHEILERKRLPWDRTIELGVQICAGLKHAHDHGIIHRDLKPANLMITDDGVLKLTDFGIAKVFAGTQLTVTGSIIGTAEYMSPEQGAGKPATKRSDLYSLGAVLYTMLTGRPPFTGKTPAELIHKHRFARFDEPRALVPDIPIWLNELVCQLLEKDPQRRPPDAYVVRRRLESVQRKVQLRESEAVADEADLPPTAVEVSDSGERDVPGTSTFMQQLLRAHLDRERQKSWLQRFLERGWVLLAALAVLVAVIVVVAGRGGERRAWQTIQRLHEAGREEDLGLLEQYMRDYLKRYPDGPHAEAVKRMMPEVLTARRRRLLLRSPVVRYFRPPVEEPSRIERLYRKALLLYWLEGESASRAVLEQIVASGEAAESDRHIVELAREDLAALDLQRAERLARAGQQAEARQLLEGIIERHAKERAFAEIVRAARAQLKRLGQPK